MRRATSIDSRVESGSWHGAVVPAARPSLHVGSVSRELLLGSRQACCVDGSPRTLAGTSRRKASFEWLIGTAVSRTTSFALDGCWIIHNNKVVDLLGTTFAALSDATRRAILFRLREGPASVHQLAEPFAISQQAISKHLAYLERAQLIAKRREGREHICHLNPAPMREVAAWVDEYQQFWTNALGQLDGLLQDLHAPNKGTQP